MCIDMRILLARCNVRIHGHSGILETKKQEQGTSGGLGDVVRLAIRIEKQCAQTHVYIECLRMTTCLSSLSLSPYIIYIYIYANVYGFLSRFEALAATLRQVFEFGLHMDLFPRVSMDTRNN